MPFLSGFKQKTRISLLLCLLMSLTLPACLGPVQMSVKRDWTNTIKSYGLIPVYPMRENVYVGDLRVTGHKDDDFSSNYRYFGQLDIAKELKEEMKRRPELSIAPKKCNAKNSNAKDRNAKDRNAKNRNAKDSNAKDCNAKDRNPKDNKEKDVTAARGHANRAFPAALPSIKMASASAGKIGAQLPFSDTQALINAGFSLRDKVEIQLEGITYLEISDKAVWDKIAEECSNYNKDETDNNLKNKEILTASLNMVTPKNFTIPWGEPDGRLHVITRVFYSDSILYTRSVSKFFSLFTRKVQPGPQDSKPLPEEPPLPEKPPPENNTGPGTLTFDKNRYSKAELSDDFKRPMAFGIDVLSFSLTRDKNGLVYCDGPVNSVSR